MHYISTRNSSHAVSASEAIVSGLSPDGGLFLPDEIPDFTLMDISALGELSYPERAAEVMSRFLTDFSKEELLSYAKSAYPRAKFGEDPAPVVKLNDTYILELFHGPTCAFKDFALQMLPYLLTASLKKNHIKKEVAILVATSGDTGKAALMGFADVPGTKICVFYPDGGTSNIQRLQMTTQSGKNVMVAAVRGNFDDTQNGVKEIFTDEAFKAELSDAGILLSSANSINWGRLVPQIAYYFSAYCDLVDAGEIRLGDEINVAVPTGNFGNILAAFFAKLSGLPIKRFLCASNRNNVLTDFIRTGIYDRNRPFYLTTSPSMDILISSNLERLLFILCGLNDEQVKEYMSSLNEIGRYEIAPEMLQALQSQFSCGCAGDELAADTIQSVFEHTDYLLDPHTAVAVSAYAAYRAGTGDETPTVIASTASPFKFPGSVLAALGKASNPDEFEMIRRLSDIADLDAPPQLTELRSKAERFTTVVDPAEMKSVVTALKNL